MDSGTPLRVIRAVDGPCQRGAADGDAGAPAAAAGNAVLIRAIAGITDNRSR
jgi:hypothetical protein